MTEKRDTRARGLGRGLSALLGDAVEDEAPIAPAPTPATGGRQPDRLPIDVIGPNPDQPRRRFEPEDLEELAASIRERGVIQPLVVRPDPERPGRYQIVAGERRWRAAQAARLHELPVVIREIDDRTMLELAIIENIQRTDLTPTEEAEGYQRLIESFGYTQEALSRIVGKSRSHLANTLRLLALPPEVRALLDSGKLTAGHARALLTAPDPVGLAREAVARGLTVRQVEARAKAAAEETDAAKPVRKAPDTQADADTRVLEGDLSAAIGMRVKISHSGPEGSGEVRIRYKTLDDLDRLCRRLAE